MKLNIPRKAKMWLLNILILIVTTVLGVVVTLATMQYIVNYEYTSMAMIYVIRNRNVSWVAASESLYQELLSTKEMARDFAIYVSTEAGLGRLQDNLGEDMPWLLDAAYNQDDHFIEAYQDPQSRVVAIRVSCDNPYDAATIANECVAICQDLCMLIYGEDYIQVVSTAQPVFKPSSPDRKLVVPIGIAAGAGLGVLVVFLLWRRELHLKKTKPHLFDPPRKRPAPGRRKRQGQPDQAQAIQPFSAPPTPQQPDSGLWNQ